MKLGTVVLIASLLIMAVGAANASDSKTPRYQSQDWGSNSTNPCRAECDKVFERARHLPEPNVRSIYDYHKEVVEQFGRCAAACTRDFRNGRIN